ncbi:hypothetical protein B0H14DRAFT_2583672 [Mycena olivaceomarginata]|nr:hypothetical protein B0H14DRAFT_2583672 [Mycena olivaceomarginata]
MPCEASASPQVEIRGAFLLGSLRTQKPRREVGYKQMSLAILGRDKGAVDIFKEATATKPSLRLGCPRRLKSTAKRGLSKVQSAGLEGPEDVFAHHNGEILSGKAFNPTSTQAALWKAEFGTLYDLEKFTFHLESR